MQPEAWSMPIIHMPKPPQPAPLAVTTLMEIPALCRESWKGKGPEGDQHEFIYVQAYNMAAILPMDRWTFSEELNQAFGKPSAAWGNRSYTTKVEYLPKTFGNHLVRAVTIQEGVRHNGELLQSDCSIVVHDTNMEAGNREQVSNVTGNWAEVPCQLLELRYFLANGILPRRMPYNTTPTTPGSFVIDPDEP